MIKQLFSLHQKLFQPDSKCHSFFAPGRVNLIGEHTDYNGGYVFPCALDIGTYAVVSTTNDRKINIYSINCSHTGVITFDLTTQIKNTEQKSWANYAKGMVKIFIDNGYSFSHGLDITIGGNIPTGAGLSSSASLEMLMANILNNIYNLNLAPLNLVKWGQSVENNFVGVNCGIMDQFASMLGKKDHALLLNCSNLEYAYAPLDLNGYTIIIANTNKQRGLADSKYNERRRECETALKQLQQKLTINSLGELDEKTLMAHEHLITNKEHQLRAKHVVLENQRVLDAVTALNNHDLAEFGRLMNQSHLSLQENYAVTGIELDTLVEAAWLEDGCIGSRMTGAGFGGCTVSIVKGEAINDFMHNVGEYYSNRCKLRADFYQVKPSDGAREL